MTFDEFKIKSDKFFSNVDPKEIYNDFMFLSMKESINISFENNEFRKTISESLKEWKESHVNEESDFIKDVSKLIQDSLIEPRINKIKI